MVRDLAHLPDEPYAIDEAVNELMNNNFIHFQPLDIYVPPPNLTKKETKWSIQEHELFLLGLEIIGKGKWKDISKYTCLQRSPSQVACHAQKYFNRRTPDEKSNEKKKRKRTSIFDITTVSQTTRNIYEDDIRKAYNIGGVKKKEPVLHAYALPLPSSSSSHFDYFSSCYHNFG